MSATLKAAIVIGIFSLAGFLLYRALSGYSLNEITSSLRNIPLRRLVAAMGFAAASYLCLTTFDWLGLRYAGHPLSYRRAAIASFVGLSLGHNIGFAGLSSGAVRYRFYSRWGLGVGDVTKVVLFSGATVGLGLLILGGIALLSQPAFARDIAALKPEVISAMGMACLLVAGLYLAACAFVRKTLQIGRWSVQLPSFPLALGQAILGPLNFAFVVACLQQVLSNGTEAAYWNVAAVYVIANTTSLITHVPGGLGVIETVVLYLLPQEHAVGAALAFRVIYFLIPLCLGSLTFMLAEGMRSRRSPGRSGRIRPESG